MSAKGKHRRPKSPRLRRTVALASTGGAALVLPLIGAQSAGAATGHESAASHSVAKSVKAAKDAGADPKPEMYSVVAGDSLSTIAAAHDVEGGWKSLYRDNREAVGADPALIRPGLKLTVEGAKASESKKPAPKPEKPEPKEPEPEKKDSGKSAPKPQAEKPAEKDSGTSPAGTGFTLPVEGSGGGTAYKVAGSMWSSGYHTGVDFAVPTGSSLKAVGEATVVSAGWGGAYGNQVVLLLADGHYAQYAHLSQLSVSAGETVSAGQQVGLSGATGNVTGPHLHFEIRTTPDYGSDVDPMAYLRAKGVNG